MLVKGMLSSYSLTRTFPWPKFCKHFEKLHFHAQQIPRNLMKNTTVQYANSAYVFSRVVEALRLFFMVHIHS